MVKSAFSLSTKCVQHVQTVCKKMCTSWVSTQAEGYAVAGMCTNNEKSTSTQQLVHMLKMSFLIYKPPHLYTLSTEPTITTICINTLRQETQ